MILPAVRFVQHFPARLWGDPQLAAGSLSAVLLGLYMIDCLSNGFPNMIYITLAGGLMGLEPSHLRLGTERCSETTTDWIGLATPTVASIALADNNCNRGRELKAQGKLREAEVVWRQALDFITTLSATHPEQPDLQHRWCDCANDLAWLLANATDPAIRNPAHGVVLAANATELRPESSTYWNTLGAAYYHSGDFKAAIAALNHAVALDGNGTPFDHVFLAMAHGRLGNGEEAQRLLGMAMSEIERAWSGHAELRHLCEEAKVILAGPRFADVRNSACGAVGALTVPL